MNCKEAIAELMQSIDANSAPSDEARRHLRECDRCKSLLASLLEEAPAELPPIDSSANAAKEALKRERRKLMSKRVLAISIVSLAFVVLLAIPSGFPFKEGLAITLGGIAIAIIIASPVLLLFSLIATAKTPAGTRRYYKRIGPGKVLDGVCLGIAQAKGWSVTIVRIAFLLGLWLHGIGLLVYIICSFAMPVHPADRQYLLRFKVARAWRRMRQASSHAA